MNESQFKSCIMPLHKSLFAYALAILHEESDAADCLQDALTKLWENRSRLKEVDNPAAYATVTVKHLAISMAARKQALTDLYGDSPPVVADSGPTPAQAFENREDLACVRDLLGQLPDNQRRVVTLSAVAGLSNSEIREATGLSDDNVRVLLSRGRKKLKQLFSKQKI